MTTEKKRVTRKNNSKTTRKTRGPTSAELKRQIAAAKLENTNLKADIVKYNDSIVKNAELAQTNPNLTNVNPNLVGEGLEDITDKFTIILVSCGSYAERFTKVKYEEKD